VEVPRSCTATRDRTKKNKKGRGKNRGYAGNDFKTKRGGDAGGGGHPRGHVTHVPQQDDPLVMTTWGALTLRMEQGGGKVACAKRRGSGFVGLFFGPPAFSELGGGGNGLGDASVKTEDRGLKVAGDYLESDIKF